MPDLTARITEILRGQFPLNGNVFPAHFADVFPAHFADGNGPEGVYVGRWPD